MYSPPTMANRTHILCSDIKISSFLSQIPDKQVSGTMGRKKIQISRILDQRNRQVGSQRRQYFIYIQNKSNNVLV